MSSEHTPGPWRVANDGFRVEQGMLSDVKLIAVAAYGDVGYAAERANACLIAAAPEMLAALEALISDARPSNWDDEEDFKHWMAWLNAKLVIAKARGVA